MMFMHTYTVRRENFSSVTSKLTISIRRFRRVCLLQSADMASFNLGSYVSQNPISTLRLVLHQRGIFCWPLRIRNTRLLDTIKLKTCQTDVGFKLQTFLFRKRCRNHLAILFLLANLDACCNFSSSVPVFWIILLWKCYYCLPLNDSYMS